LRFSGQVADEGGLYYNYFRDYDPSTGRYIQSDPIGLEGGLNTYLYANANPQRFIDPQGSAAQLPIAIGGAAINICMRIPACKKATQDAVKAYKNVRCKFERHKAHHTWNGKYCEHYHLVCYIKGSKQLFRKQWPFPGRCSPIKPSDWMP
ncbi:RHS repeat domain-containing protein, partial [Solemya velesiana gill symbiont]|uniref:RHS repeat domain-containing protein n=1 Tax=Solemya velesiana gill symbiont TaxID=1918948 RepID=UPI0010835F0A